MIKVGVIGATGYVGSELVRLLIQHPHVEIHSLSTKSYAGKNYADIYSSYRHMLPFECENINIKQHAKDCDVIFLALPHGIASELVNSDILEDTIVIDLGADFRFKKIDVYEKWYSVNHQSSHLLDNAVYGLCEIKRDEIKKSRLIANPGCYTTCSILSLAPLVKAGLIDYKSIIIDAKSGASGAGRSLTLNTHFTEVNENMRAYNIAAHRHNPEIEEQLSEISGVNITLSFTPHFIPVNRGIITTSYATLKDLYSYDYIKKIYDDYYKNDYFIRLTKENIFPETKWVKGSNFCDIGFKIDERCGRIIVVGSLDNLIKGASGQAVQNMNILFGLDEKIGLDNIPIFPI